MRFSYFSGFLSRRELGKLVSVLSLLAIAPGCPLQAPMSAAPSPQSTTSALSSTNPAPAASSAPTVVQGGPRAIRIIFKQNYPAGSFDASPGNGTVPQPGSGQQATRYFNPDGSLLAGSGPGTSTWLSSFEIGISGANNTSAKNANCAKFADTTESTATTNCKFGAGPIGCGAPNGLYRISEYDCLSNSSQVAVDGNGGPNDGVYLRAIFNRALLGSGENLLATVEYVASAFDGAPSAPYTCFNAGVPAPELCSNVTWKTFIKHSVGEMVQPFLMLVPPNQNFVQSGIGTTGVSPQMRQFVIPLAGDPQLSVLQISRIHSNLDTTKSFQTCNNNNYPGTPTGTANSPLCAGIVLYSLTLFRI